MSRKEPCLEHIIDDITSHKSAWLSCFDKLIELTKDEDDKSYYEHERHALECVTNLEITSVSRFEEMVVVPKAAWDLALGYLAMREPPDSRAVSDEFVALACATDLEDLDKNPLIMQVIEKALEEVKRKLESGEYLKDQPELVVKTDKDLEQDALIAMC